MKPNHYMLDVAGVPREVCMDIAKVVQLFQDFEHLLKVRIVNKFAEFVDLNTEDEGFIVNFTINKSKFYAHSFSRRGTMNFDIHSCGLVNPRVAFDALMAAYEGIFEKDLCTPFARYRDT